MTTNRPWNETGTSVQGLKTNVLDAMEEKGLNFTVKVMPAYVHITEEDNVPIRVPGHNFIMRTDNYGVLGHCKDVFTPLQNSVLAKVAQSFIDKGSARLNAIGCLGKGERVWILLELTDRTYTIVTDDEVTLYLLLVNGHDGSTSVMIGIIPFRFSCSNMFPRIGKHMIKFKHTESVEEMLSFFKIRLNAYLQKTDEYINGLKLLTQFKPTQDRLDAYFKELFGFVTKSAETELSTKAQNKLNRLMDLFVNGTGNTQELVAGTWYAAFNAVTEYLNFEAGRTEETRLNSLWFGKNADVSQCALELALDFCKGE